MTSKTIPAAEFHHVKKVFNPGQANAFTALHDVSLSIAENEFFTFLGPSGCGKTTLLRILAGFEQPTSGDVKLFDKDIAHLPANKRPVNTVFQHYALFPHLTVRDNVGFALKMLGQPAHDILKTCNEMLELVHMEDFADRKPEQLSGGQRQRVALARALAPHPKLLLLDEPLSALDLKLRQAMRIELKMLQRETGITFVFVTHDQEEALAMSDRIAVLSQGNVQQVGTPATIYERPANRFVADFIGQSNLINVTVKTASKTRSTVEIDQAGVIQIDSDIPLKKGESVTLAIRPERIIFNVKASKSSIKATVKSHIYLGNANEFILAVGDAEIIARAPQGGIRGKLSYQPGDTVSIGFEPGAIRVLRS